MFAQATGTELGGRGSSQHKFAVQAKLTDRTLLAWPASNHKPFFFCRRLLLYAGVYNEEVFASLDWVLDQASRRNIRIIIPFEARACSCTAVTAVKHVLAVAVTG